MWCSEGAGLSALSLLGLALAGFIGGAVFMAAVVFVGIKLNLKGLGKATADLRRDAGFYRAWALMGGTLGAAWLTAMPLLDASGMKDPWYGLIMIVIGLAVFIPMMLCLKRRRHRTGREAGG
jgi:hypothetical protein